MNQISFALLASIHLLVTNNNPHLPMYNFTGYDSLQGCDCITFYSARAVQAQNPQINARILLTSKGIFIATVTTPSTGSSALISEFSEKKFKPAGLIAAVAKHFNHPKPLQLKLPYPEFDARILFAASTLITQQSGQHLAANLKSDDHHASAFITFYLQKPQGIDCSVRLQFDRSKLFILTLIKPATISENSQFFKKFGMNQFTPRNFMLAVNKVHTVAHSVY